MKNLYQCTQWPIGLDCAVTQNSFRLLTIFRTPPNTLEPSLNFSKIPDYPRAWEYTSQLPEVQWQNESTDI